MKLPTKIPDSEVNPKTRVRRNLKRFAIEYKGGCCEHCGYKKYEEALDFHHVDPRTKEYNICFMLRQTVDWTKIKKEVDKCQLLCCRCHREVHIQMNENRKAHKQETIDRKVITLSPKQALSITKNKS